MGWKKDRRRTRDDYQGGGGKGGGGEGERGEGERGKGRGRGKGGRGKGGGGGGGKGEVGGKGDNSKIQYRGVNIKSYTTSTGV